MLAGRSILCTSPVTNIACLVVRFLTGHWRERRGERGVATDHEIKNVYMVLFAVNKFATFTFHSNEVLTVITSHRGRSEMGFHLVLYSVQDTEIGMYQVIIDIISSSRGKERQVKSGVCYNSYYSSDSGENGASEFIRATAEILQRTTNGNLHSLSAEITKQSI